VFRRIVAHFRVPHPTRVRIFVREVSPLCRRIGAYTVAAKRGTNAVRLPKRIGTHRLGAGTYVLTGKKAGKRLFKARARIIRGRTLLLRRGGGTETCGGARTTVAVALPTVAPPATQHEVLGSSASGTVRPHQPDAPGRSWQRSPLVRALSLSYAPNPLRPFLLALLVAALALFAVALMPKRVLPTGHATAFVAQQRGWIVATAIWLLAVVAALVTFG
jgi:hypothetical protein